MQALHGTNRTYLKCTSDSQNHWHADQLPLKSTSNDQDDLPAPLCINYLGINKQQTASGACTAYHQPTTSEEQATKITGRHCFISPGQLEMHKHQPALICITLPRTNCTSGMLAQHLFLLNTWPAQQFKKAAPSISTCLFCTVCVKAGLVP